MRQNLALVIGLQGRFAEAEDAYRDTLARTADRTPDAARTAALDDVRWMLEEVGAPYDTEIIGYDQLKGPAYLAVNPMGKVPAIKTVRFLSLSGNTAGADGVAAGTIDWQTGPVPNIDKVSQVYPGYDSATVNQSQIATPAAKADGRARASAVVKAAL